MLVYLVCIWKNFLQAMKMFNSKEISIASIYTIYNFGNGEFELLKKYIDC